MNVQMRLKNLERKIQQVNKTEAVGSHILSRDGEGLYQYRWVNGVSAKVRITQEEIHRIYNSTYPRSPLIVIDIAPEEEPITLVVSKASAPEEKN